MKLHTTPKNSHHKSDLVRIANNAMHERQLLTEFSAQVMHEVAAMRGAANDTDPAIRDNLSAAGVEPLSGNAADLSKLIKSDLLRYAQLAKSANIKGD